MNITNIYNTIFGDNFMKTAFKKLNAETNIFLNRPWELTGQNSFKFTFVRTSFLLSFLSLIPFRLKKFLCSNFPRIYEVLTARLSSTLMEEILKYIKFYLPLNFLNKNTRAITHFLPKLHNHIVAYNQTGLCSNIRKNTK